MLCAATQVDNENMSKNSEKKIAVGIVGAAGYVGAELLRLLAGHEAVDVCVATSESEQGKSIGELFPGAPKYSELLLCAHEDPQLQACELVFFATPHATAMYHAPALYERQIKIIDLSADFRLRDPAQWRHWYGLDHAAPGLLSEAVYGLPELNREHLATARLVAVAGCYPTAVILGLLPLLETDSVVPDSLIADAKSGLSGAGRRAVAGNLFCEVSDSFKAYAVQGHRHLPEIIQALSLVCDQPPSLTFVPHLAPMIRGIFATLYARARHEDIDLEQIYARRYGSEPFVTVLADGAQPGTRLVRGTNKCCISTFRPQDGNQLIVLSLIDNLIKGAAGQAIQCMNIMFGLDETTGLTLTAGTP